MKDLHGDRRIQVAALVAAAFIGLGLYGQQFSVSWCTVDGGGGTNTGGAYSVTGTIGHPDAGEPMIGEPYAMRGGFWAFEETIQNPGATTLRILQSDPGFVTISWATDDVGWFLQETAAVPPANWTNSPKRTNTPVVVPANSVMRFYRLRRS